MVCSNIHLGIFPLYSGPYLSRLNSPPAVMLLYLGVTL
ncbi:hypothetical protein YPPY66_4457 [Yersinia pestis PY-66]|uniref:Uncharacterized protein n=2 Tax=Yersinia pestis TaxID=632 RepID=A0AAV3BDX8_YERPE|nr:hypothetical protein YPIP275_0201 [Yersinia pestis biovar Orientalis str. IP275]EDR37757.1 hypothetical protein YpF1991016_2368 [Yersinia pestis biovar Orientalis str. F1991016]EDR41398.1 hypothetical protein YpE1979001_4471 [Yersinia pestis biovar Antiqua str. E1979001]EDR57620.1 hypothetical protein YpMG051020_4058 [Yersinia pestis biovar Orientalis str. MG05-1020]EFA47927.1 hypothetical protein YPD27_2173 [Yersinia pestis KIM D27]EIQ84516.1 hypothetical protein YPPY01_4065 [Yersinia pest